MSDSNQTGWVWLRGQLVGNLENWSVVYSWDGRWFADREVAVKAGLNELDHDDFNVGYVDAGKLTWFGWMDEQHPTEDYPEVARQFGWTA